jgi:hypothetical protein
VNLTELQVECLHRWEALRRAYGPGVLAAPFFSVKTDATNRAQRPILLVGKATHKDWCLKSFEEALELSIPERLEGCRKTTQKWLELQRQSQSRMFWRFWKQIYDIGPQVIWTNLAKIGTLKGNPPLNCIQDQSDLACRTLNAEVEEYKPQLIVLVSAGFAVREIVYPAFNTRSRNQWQEFKLEDKDDYCQLKGVPGRPTVLWFNHPQLKSAKLKNLWLEKIRESMAPELR